LDRLPTNEEMELRRI